jgi:prepilin-type N-terminal cleavage/methylation domain-containing protein
MHATAYTLSRNRSRQPKGKGFTLIELAVAIAIITLLLGSLLVPLQTQVAQRQISDTQKALDDIKEGLLGFAVANGYLPCPDTDNDGLENVAGSGLCSSISSNIASGNLPWQTLGITVNADVWGNRFRYSVRDEYARRPPYAGAPFSLTTTAPNLRVCETSTCASILTASAVAVVLSHGKNGYGATNSLSGTTNPAATSADELEDTNNDRTFVSRVMTESGASAGEYDDIVTWLPSYLLFNRMVSAGKLP